VKKKALSRGESHLVGLPQFTHLRTLPFFFEDGDGQAITVTSHRYTVMINEFPSPKASITHNLGFQQDGATPHMTVINMAVLRHLFPQQVLSHFGDVPWPPCLLDVTAPDFFLWGYLKSNL
jgi:hypothetical protein